MAKYILVLLMLCSMQSLVAAQETEIIYLSGHDKDQTVDWEFMCTTGAKSGKWTTIPVPSNWDVLGFGMLNYKKDRETALEEKGLYRHKFMVPQQWSGKRAVIVFEGVQTDTLVKINGQLAGPIHQGGFYRFQYEITDLLTFGEENLLEVEVAKHSANKSVNKAERTADFWVFGGIYRPVYLRVLPQDYIERIAIDAQASGDFSADVFLSPELKTGKDLRIEAQIQTLAGDVVGKPFSEQIQTEDSVSSITVTTKIDSPKLWSAETPSLYQAEVKLMQGEQILHQITERFGFRTVEVKPGDGIYVNGRRVVLKGVNRHSTWPDSGKCLSEEVHRLDIETIQAMNMNAVRMSHYPPDPQFLDLCDELGLYVLDELAGWHWHYDTLVGSKLVKEMVTRDVNHPSVLFWNNGNEGGFNYSLDEQFSWYDPQKRTVLHPWEAFNHINTAHYLEYDRAIVASRGVPTRHGTGEVYQEWEDYNDPNKYIYMPTEMLHGLYDGGSGAGLEAYWDVMQQSPVLGGGFLWVLFDEGIRREDGSIDCEGNSAPDGIIGPYREREASFYTVKEIWSPVQVVFDGASKLSLKNEYSFTNLNQCQLHWKLVKFRKPSEDMPGFRVIEEAEPALPAVEPGKQGELQLALRNTEQADALSVRIDDPSGRELWTWVWPLRELNASTFLAAAQSQSAVDDQETGNLLKFSTGDLKIEIDKQTGLLKAVEQGSQKFSFTNGPISTIGNSKLNSISTMKQGNSFVASASFEGPLQKLKWTIHPSGWVDCEYTYSAEGTFDYLGVTFDYPDDFVKAKKWLGNGPFRVWKNRRKGGTLNVWENEKNETITGYSMWKYPEFRGCFSDVHWMQLLTTEGKITIVPHQTNGFVQVLSPKQPPKEMVGKTEFSLPDCGVALLDAIPPVGSKFKTPETTGPRGQPNILNGSFSGGVSFYFGELPVMQ